MTLKQFIKKNKVQLDKIIYSSTGVRVRLNDNERKKWIMNEESLYDWARDEGVEI